MVKNEIKSIDSSNNIINKLSNTLNNDKAVYIKHKPNKKILGTFRFYLSTYNFGTSVKNPYKNESKRWRRYLREIGEAPIILDTIKIKRSEENLRNYLLSKGYLNCDISSKIKYRKKKAKVIYYINPKKVYLIRDVKLSADDADIDKLLNDTLDKCLLEKENPLDIDLIGKERNRLTNVLRNAGYYDFNKDFFDFELDTLKSKYDTLWKPNYVKINIGVSNKSDDERFLPKTIQAIYVNFENDAETQKVSPAIIYNQLHIAVNGYPLKPHIIGKTITIRPGDLFKQTELENTYNKLSELPIFKFIDIAYKPSVADSLNGLDMIITLKTSFRKSYAIEPQGLTSQLNRIQNTNNANSFGLANNISFTNKNAFKNAEQLDISSSTRFEIPFYRNPNTKKFTYDAETYSFQQGLNFSLSFPRSSFLSFLEKKFPNNIKSIKTNFNASLIFENNPEYLRRIIPLTYQYQIATKKLNWFLNLVEISYSKNDLKGNVDLSGRTDSAFIKRLFSNNIVTSTGISFIYNNKAFTKSRTSFYVRANAIEFGGNIHRLIRRIEDKNFQKSNSYQLFGIDYFQYSKSEIDAKCSTIIDENYSTAVRLNIGIAYPYGNQKVLPFDKLFFIGGSNSLRAWRPRTIGPGSYTDSGNSFRIDRAGDIIIQGSAEVRFDLIKPLELALFIDAGNVWLSRSNIFTDPRKVLSPKNFLTDMAIGTGAGLRIDFSFFLFRLDYGIQMHNPEKDKNSAWVIREFAQNNYFSKYGVLNFGIGYPF